MALDRQRILGELGSVMQQLQSADCGCLGKLFGNSQQAATPAMGSPLPTCGGCRRGCCHGHGYGQYSQTPMNQLTPNMNYTPPMESTNSQQHISGNMYGVGPQIVNMMRGDHHPKSENMKGYEQGQLMGPMVIDAPQSPHGKVGLTPFTPTSMVQQGQVSPDIMNRGDIGGLTQNQLIPQSSTNTGNTGLSPWSQQNMRSNPAAHQMGSAQMNPWVQQDMSSHPAVHQSSPRSNPHGQHSEGIDKFNKMFPGVKQGLGGDLGFDPMAIAIQMNPNNQLQSAMATMNNIMNGNKGMNQVFNKAPAPQTTLASNTINQISPDVPGTIQQNAVPNQVAQSNMNPMSNQDPTSNVIQNQVSPNQQYANANAYGQPIPQQNQQMYTATINPNAVNQQMRHEDNQEFASNQQHGQQIMNLNSDAPNMPTMQYQATVEDNQLVAPPQSTGYPNQAPVQQINNEPIFPADTSKNQINMPIKQQKNDIYSYNTLGQPVQMLPAKMYHPPEPSLPQTLSPQPVLLKPKIDPLRALNVKGTVSKTSLMGNKQVGKTPSRAQLQHVYNQYKGSQSFTQQNVRHPGEGTSSDGRLNVPQAGKTPPVPVERVGGDTVVSNPPSNQEGTNKLEQLTEQIGDVPAAKPAGDTLPLKEAPVPIRKSRNGLQDMVFSTYPTSAAWTFHGHGRDDRSQAQRFRHRHF